MWRPLNLCFSSFWVLSNSSLRFWYLLTSLHIPYASSSIALWVFSSSRPTLVLELYEFISLACFFFIFCIFFSIVLLLSISQALVSACSYIISYYCMKFLLYSLCFIILILLYKSLLTSLQAKISWRKLRSQAKRFLKFLCLLSDKVGMFCYKSILPSFTFIIELLNTLVPFCVKDLELLLKGSF